MEIRGLIQRTYVKSKVISRTSHHQKRKLSEIGKTEETHLAKLKLLLCPRWTSYKSTMTATLNKFNLWLILRKKKKRAGIVFSLLCLHKEKVDFDTAHYL